MTILYVTGIVAGLAVPAVPAYLALSASLLVIGSATFRTFRNFSDIVLLGTWFFLGAARVGLHTDSHERDAGWIAAMQEEAMTQKDSFVGRLSSGTSSPRAIAISAALLCGDKSLLDADTRESFKRVGASPVSRKSARRCGIRQDAAPFVSTLDDGQLLAMGSAASHTCLYLVLRLVCGHAHIPA